MLKKTILSAAALLFLSASTVNAQIPSQNQLIVPPYQGLIVSTSTASNGKLSATSSPTVGYITATSTTKASTFPFASSTAITVSGTIYNTSLSDGCLQVSTFAIVSTGSACGSGGGGGTDTNWTWNGASILRVSTTTNNVAIATTSPVIAGTSLYNLTVGSASNTNNGIAIDASSAGTAALTFASNGSVVSGGGRIAYSNANSRMEFATGGVTGTMRMVITSTGNIGIGTSTPSSRLTVYDSANIYSMIAYGNGGNNGVAMGTFAGNVPVVQGYNVNFSATSNLSLQPSGGFLGIGTTTPSSKVSISDSDRDMTSALTNVDVNSTSAQATGRGGSIQFGGLYNSGGATASFGGIKGVKENSTDDNTAGALTFYTRGNGGPMTERARIGSTGNVGIGTASPDIGAAGGKVLTVSGSFTRARLQLHNVDGTSIGSVAGTIQFIGGVTSLADITSASVGAVNSGYLAFSTINASSSSEKMRILPNGNIGIGTTTPPNRLTVQTSANAVALNTTDGTVYSTIYNGTAGSNTGSWYSTQSNHPIFFNTNGQNPQMVITTAGFLGIGTTTPATTLSVQGNALVSGTATVGNLIATNTASILSLATATGSWLAVNPSGQIIATTSPQVAGNYITALTGDVAATGPGSVAATLATVNANVGSFGSSTAIPSFTVNGKGLITAASSNVVVAPAGTLTGTTLASNVVTSSLTSVGTLSAGAVPASLVTSGTFGAGNYTFPSDVTVSGNSTTTNATTTNLYVSGTLSANIKQYPAFTYSTTTAWTGTTTLPLGPAYVAETWNGVQCFTDTGTVNVSFNDGTNRMNLLNASTTVGVVTLSTNNAFTASEKRYVDIGTPASSPTKVSCTVSKTLLSN
jgi:hypothetical protein